MTPGERRAAWRAFRRTGSPPALRAVVLATYTAEPLAPYLGMGLVERELPAAVTIGPFDQIAQELLDAGSETAMARPDVIVVHARLEEVWRGQPAPLDADWGAYAANALELAAIAAEGAARLGATLIFVLPAVPADRPLGVGDAGNPRGVSATAARVREALREALAARPGVLVADMEEALRAAGGTRAFDPRLDAVARIPYTEEAFLALGEAIAALVALARRPARRVLAVDADNTLWGGVVGEDGPAGIALGSAGAGRAFVAFQEHLLALRRAGLLLALVSKNHEDDVRAAFARPEMVLDWASFAAVRANWEPKSANLRAIAQELGLGLDAFVFVDDNPLELAEVAAAHPEVACVRFPADPAEWRATLAAGVLDRLPPTADDLARAAFYQVEASRREILGASTDMAGHLAGLALAIAIEPPAPLDVPRLAQLVGKTNQFNLTGRRRAEPELAALLADGQHLVRLVRAADRFGDYGAVGAFVLRLEGTEAELDTFVLSCRALGRGIEAAMAAEAAAAAAERGAVLVGAAAELPRNQPARRFFAGLGLSEPGLRGPITAPPWPDHAARA